MAYRLFDPAIPNKAIGDGILDIWEMCRPMIADPHMPKKVLEGRSHEIVACDSCNVYCYAPAFKRRVPKGAPICKFNERVGREWEIPQPRT
jgi:2,4-dienoyl-CoA reductase (NADPH2)